MSLDEVLRFRCEPELKARFEKIAAMKRRDASDLARLVFEDYVASEEMALKEAGKAGEPTRETKITSYAKEKRKRQRPNLNKREQN